MQGTEHFDHIHHVLSLTHSPSLFPPRLVSYFISCHQCGHLSEKTASRMATTVTTRWHQHPQGRQQDSNGNYMKNASMKHDFQCKLLKFAFCTCVLLIMWMRKGVCHFDSLSLPCNSIVSVSFLSTLQTASSTRRPTTSRRPAWTSPTGTARCPTAACTAAPA